MIKYALVAIDKLMQVPLPHVSRGQDVKNCSRPFGGCVVALCGDLRQTAAIVEHGTETECIRASLPYWRLWSQVRFPVSNG